MVPKPTFWQEIKVQIIMSSSILKHLKIFLRRTVILLNSIFIFDWNEPGCACMSTCVCMYVRRGREVWSEGTLDVRSEDAGPPLADRLTGEKSPAVSKPQFSHPQLRLTMLIQVQPLSRACHRRQRRWWTWNFINYTYRVLTAYTGEWHNYVNTSM